MFMHENGIHIEFQSHAVHVLVSSYQGQNNKMQLKVNLKSFYLLKNSSLFDKIKAKFT